jgi:hypothetical protein
VSQAVSSRLSGTAVVAFALGAASVLFSVLTALPALYLGLQAVRAINGSDGQIRGRRLAIAGLALALFGTTVTALGILAVVLLGVQQKRNRLDCANNLRQIGQAINTYHDKHNGFFPSGTVPNPALPPDQRLSWQAAIEPFLVETVPGSHKRAKPELEIDFEGGWQAPANAEPLRTNVSFFLCPSFVREFANGRNGLTAYPGLSGVGLDAATLDLFFKISVDLKIHTDFGFSKSVWIFKSTLDLKNTNAGFFGYDRNLRSEDVAAGLSSTIIVVETASDNGPWLAGGPPTVRGLDPDCDHYFGYKRPFGGLHDAGLNVLWADGAVHFRSDQIDPAVFRAQARINRTSDE